MSDDGFAIIPDVVGSDEVASLFARLAVAPMSRSRAGARHLLNVPEVSSLARHPKLMAIAASFLGCTPIPFGATLFDKSADTNWLVVWHQDTALPLRLRLDVHGWGPWSVKDGVTYAHAPAAALSRVVALRVHLDDSLTDNGPLRVLPGSHTLGVLTDAQIHDLAARIPHAVCTVPRGGVVVMRPLIVHSSSKARSPLPRRVIHIEYAETIALESGLELCAA